MAGRKGRYETHVKPKLKEIEYWCRDGEIEDTIIKKLGVAKSTFEKYKVENEELREALKNGKQVIDYQVENMLLKRAMGFSYTEKKKVEKPDGSTEYTETVKQVVPDTTAQIFWLKNRQHDKWRDKKNVDVNMLETPKFEGEDEL